jgi:hypothetical protein
MSADPSEMGADARKWAIEFQKIAEELYKVKLDEGFLIGWFANAIMAGYDECDKHRDFEDEMIQDEFRSQFDSLRT